MEDPTPATPVPQKRPLEEDIEAPVTTPIKANNSTSSSPLSVLSMQTPSPLKFTPSLAVPGNTNGLVATASPAQQPAKRRKLTQKEKDDARLEKEAKAKAREKKRAQKEAEEKLKAEQKAQKEEDKQKKVEEREEKRRQKEEEQQQKEEEKAKKERVSLVVPPHILIIANLPQVSDEAECFLHEAKGHWR
jgi:chromatin assembly factor 1 subunit A